jgi:hypothetical protein
LRRSRATASTRSCCSCRGERSSHHWALRPSTTSRAVALAVAGRIRPRARSAGDSARAVHLVDESRTGDAEHRADHGAPLRRSGPCRVLRRDSDHRSPCRAAELQRAICLATGKTSTCHGDSGEDTRGCQGAILDGTHFSATARRS